MSRRPRARLLGLLLALLAAEAALGAGPARAQGEWIAPAGDAGGQRWSAARQIGVHNVAQLVPVWTHRHGDLQSPDEVSSYAYSVTPLYVDETLYLCTPFNRVLALDPASGAERWSYDPEIDRSVVYPLKYNCRGVSYWRDPDAAEGPCSRRIFAGTVDRRLLALDAVDGQPCQDFGSGGTLSLAATAPEAIPGEFSLSSPPVVVGDVLVVGSAIADNVRAESPPGTVRAFDARSGAPRWSFDTTRRAEGAAPATLGGANVWSSMSVDEARGLVFLPVGSASPDHWGGQRPGDGRYANSLVALHARSGEVAWHFQAVHHDLWDYDLAAQPILTRITRQGRARDVVVLNTKMGLVFVLDRDSGEPVFPVEERAVPNSRARGEQASPTQPFPLSPPPLTPLRLRPEDAWGIDTADRAACRERLEALRSEGIYTPPDEQGTVLFPSTLGGVNWGGGAVDPSQQLMVVATNRFAHLITLLPDWSARWWWAALRSRLWPAEGILAGFGRVPGAPYGFLREELRAPSGLPCNPPPWGALSAVDLRQGRRIWEVPLGETRGIPGSGAVGLGGPLVTGGGLVFVAASRDGHLRAFEIGSGRELWKARLPAGGQASPMSYLHRGRQFVVLAAGGNSWLGTPLGDHLVAYALPE